MKDSLAAVTVLNIDSVQRRSTTLTSRAVCMPTEKDHSLQLFTSLGAQPHIVAFTKTMATLASVETGWKSG